MNKFEKALNGIYECAVMCYDLDTANECKQILQELVDKGIPKKPIEISMFPCCPNCYSPVVLTDFAKEVIVDYCPNCGQKIDWGGENE